MEHKSFEGLNLQLENAENKLGSEFFSNTEKRDEVLEMDLEDIKTKYSYRYEQYLKLVRDAKEEGVSENELISIRKYIALINNLEEYISTYEKGKPEGFLRDHQEDVFHKISEFLNKGKKSGYLELPTGFGKTVLFVELIRALARDKKQKKLKTLVLVPTQDLVVQTIGKSEDQDLIKGFAKFAPEINVTAYYQKEKDLSGDVVVSTYQSFIALQKSDPDFTKQFDIVIFDEAHKVLGEVTKEQIKSIAPNALQIGCTATSESNDGRAVSDVLPELIHRVTPKEAIELSILANPRGFLYRTGIKIKGEIGNLIDYPSAVLNELNTEARNRAAIDFVKTFVSRGIKGIVPCFPGERGQHARDMADAIASEKITDINTAKERNIITKSITEDTSKQDRSKIYEQFQKGEIDCITYIDILSTGVDLPNAKFLVRCRPRRSKIDSTQEIGRVLRPFEGQDPYVVEFEDEFPVGDKPYTIFDMFDIREINQGEKVVEEDLVFEITHKIDDSFVEEDQNFDFKNENTSLNSDNSAIKSEPSVVEIKVEEDSEYLINLKEKQEQQRELVRELLGKMSIDPVLVRELRVKEEQELSRENLVFETKEQAQIIFESYPQIKDLVSCDLMVFLKSGFGRRKIKGQTILRHFGNGMENTENMHNLFRLAGLEVAEMGKVVDYEKPRQLRKLLASGPVSFKALADVSFTDFKKMKFGGKNGLLEVTGTTILRRFGSGLENTSNLRNLLVFVGMEIKLPTVETEGKEVDFTKKEEVIKLLSSATIPFEELSKVTTENFIVLKFGGGETGLKEISGWKILDRYGVDKSAKTLRDLLRFAGLNVQRPVDYSNLSDFYKLLKTKPGLLDEIRQKGVMHFMHMKFGGSESEFREVTGKSILRSFGNRQENQTNLSDLLKFYEEYKPEMVPEKEGQIIDYKNPNHINAVLSKSNPVIDFTLATYQDFRKASFGGIGTGFIEIRGQALLKNFSGKETNEGLQEMLKFSGRDVVRVYDYNNSAQLRELVQSNPGIDLNKANLETFLRSSFGGLGTKFFNTNGRNILNNFGDKKISASNYKNFVSFLGIN